MNILVQMKLNVDRGTYLMKICGWQLNSRQLLCISRAKGSFLYLLILGKQIIIVLLKGVPEQSH